MSSPIATWSSLSCARWRRRQRLCPSRTAATTRRTSRRSGWAASASTAVSGLSCRSRSASGGTTMRSTARATGDGLGPRHTAEQRLQVRGGRKILLLDRRQGALGEVRAAQPGAQVRLPLEEVRGRHQGEEAGVLVPPGRGDVPLGVEGGDGQGIGNGLGGHVPHGAACRTAPPADAEGDPGDAPGRGGSPGRPRGGRPAFGELSASRAGNRRRLGKLSQYRRVFVSCGPPGRTGVR